MLAASEETRRIDMDDYLAKDGFVETRDVKTMYLEWCKTEGVVMPKCEYPAYFENGVIGVRCIEDIGYREAYIYVPYKMVFTVEKVKSQELLKPIIEQHQHRCSDQMVLCLGIFYQLTLGQHGYWYPFWRQLPEVILPSDWTEHELALI